MLVVVHGAEHCKIQAVVACASTLMTFKAERCIQTLYYEASRFLHLRGAAHGLSITVPQWGGVCVCESLAKGTLEWGSENT